MENKLTGSQSGFSLIETMIALAIFAFGILAIAALQVGVTRATSAAQYTTQASLLASQATGTLWGSPTSAALSSYNGIDTKSNNPVIASLSTWADSVRQVLPQGRGQIGINGNQATVTISWQDRLGNKSYVLTSQIGYE